MFLLPTFRAYTHYIFIFLCPMGTIGICVVLPVTKVVMYDPKLRPHTVIPKGGKVIRFL